MLHSPRFQVRILILSDRLEVAILNIVVRPLVVMERGVLAMNLLNDLISLVSSLIVVWFGWWLNNRRH